MLSDPVRPRRGTDLVTRTATILAKPIEATCTVIGPPMLQADETKEVKFTYNDETEIWEVAE